MIDTADIQAFLNKVEGGTVAVDLFKVTQPNREKNSSSSNKTKPNITNYRIALDIEDCLDRFYGGYYSDWACGGQWNRAYQFVQILISAFKNAHIEIIAFFDGTLKKNKKLTAERIDFRQKTISVLKHIRMMATPPPKIWWLPPSGTRTTLRNALRHVNVQIVQTVNDHSMEVIDYFQEYKLDAILGLHPDYIIANTSRYFSSHDLRLSYKGALETREFLVSKLLTSLSLTSDHLPFLAVFLGGYILIDETILKKIYKCCNIDYSLDFEARIRKIAEVVRNSPTNDIDEFIKQLNLVDYENEIKESVQYYQRKGKFSKKKCLAPKKLRIITIESTPFASETNENDTEARKILTDVNNLVNEEPNNIETNESEKSIKKLTNTKDINKKQSIAQFVYTLPGEVLKTALNRHQRGIMDPKIYQLLTQKEIILPQLLEDEQYREIPSVHLFYRPARQMIYAILFNLYHQKYLCSKRNIDDKKNDKKDKNIKIPEIKISEWLWSPQNEYKEPDIVTAQILPWAVPTVQRLWFGMAYEDKQRRMKAFLTIMRSDSQLMLDRAYVPQHMLVMACVLRYIVTSPDRNILTRQELDAFLAAAFSSQLPLVEYTQKLVLPGVYLRGVYLATLFMQGIETASLANDACGVPLPWTMTNPWLFFDGKLFHLKLKMSTCVTTLRELCDGHIDVVLKIDRFRKAILEDVEHFLLPSAHLVDPMYRPGFLPQPAIPLAYNAKGALHQLTSATNTNGPFFYNSPTPFFSLSPALLSHEPIASCNPSLQGNRHNHRGAGVLRSNSNNNRKGYQLKVGGIVTGSWAAGGVTTRSLFGPPGNRVGNRLTNTITRFATNNRGKTSVGVRLQRNQNQATTSNTRGSISRAYGNKMNSRNRTKKRKERKSKVQLKKTTIAEPESKEESDNSKTDNEKDDEGTENDNETEKILEKVKNLSLTSFSKELQNGTTALVSDLANSMCDEILKDEEDNSENFSKLKIIENPKHKSFTKNSLDLNIGEILTDETIDIGASGDTISNINIDGIKSLKGGKNSGSKKGKIKKACTIIASSTNVTIVNDEKDLTESDEIGQSDVSVKG